MFKYHGVDVSIIQLEAAQIIAGLKLAAPHLSTAFGEDEDEIEYNLHHLDAANAIAFSPDDDFYKFKRRLILSRLTQQLSLVEPFVQYLADKEPLIDRLHTSANRWGAFGVAETLDEEQREELDKRWEKYQNITGKKINVAERPRLFNVYTILNAAELEDNAEVTPKAIDAYKKYGGVKALDEEEFPITRLAIIGAAEPSHRLFSSDEIRDFITYEEGGRSSIGLYATSDGIKKLEEAVRPLNIKLAVKTTQVGGQPFVMN